jgi:CRISPR-associated protein Cas5d
VTSITLLKPIRTISVLRNEAQSKISPTAVKRWMRNPLQFRPLVAGAGQDTDGTPRNSVLLRDVAYWIDAYPHVFDSSGDNTPAKYVAMLERRVEKGQCYQRPYLGCREFVAEFGPKLEDDRPQSDTREIGPMLYDIAFIPEGNRAVFFEARLTNGVMDTRPETALPNKHRRLEVLQCSYRR